VPNGGENDRLRHRAEFDPWTLVDAASTPKRKASVSADNKSSS
jgi:hypothetical protein